MQKRCTNWNDGDSVLRAFQRKRQQDVPNEFKGSKQALMNAMDAVGSLSHSIFRGASAELKRDREFTLHALKHTSGIVLRDAAEDLKADRCFVLECVNVQGGALNYCSYRGDKEVVLAAVKNKGDTLMYASTELQDDKEVAMAAVANYGTAIAHASARLQADAELASEAVKQNGDAFQYVAKELKADKRLAIAAVRNTCYALKFATAKLKVRAKGDSTR